jgi:hypothetical protein
MGEKWSVYYKPRKIRLAGLLGDYNLLRQSDLEKKSQAKYGKKLFLRPDRIKQAATNKTADLEMNILSCWYNGKCYEVLGETKNGNHLMAYSPKALETEKSYFFNLET